VRTEKNGEGERKWTEKEKRRGWRMSQENLIERPDAKQWGQANPTPSTPQHSVFRGNLVNLFTDEIYPAEIEVENGTIISISRTGEEVKGFIVPGLIDAHIHIESSMLTPSNFAAASVPHGTTGVVADAHEIVNIAGMQGFRYMLEDAKGVPLKFFFTAPSCVPSTPMDAGGAVIGAPEIREMFGLGAVAPGEVMNFPGVISGEEGLMQKIAIAGESKTPVDGHAPGLTGKALDAYISAGISTDHECLSFEEAWEKAEKGIIPMILEGSAAQGIEMLSGLIGRRQDCPEWK